MIHKRSKNIYSVDMVQMIINTIAFHGHQETLHGKYIPDNNIHKLGQGLHNISYYPLEEKE